MMRGACFVSYFLFTTLKFAAYKTKALGYLLNVPVRAFEDYIVCSLDKD